MGRKVLSVFMLGLSLAFLVFAWRAEVDAKMRTGMLFFGVFMFAESLDRAWAASAAAPACHPRPTRRA